MAIGVTVVSQIIALFYVICEFLNTLQTLIAEIDIALTNVIFVTDVAVLNIETIKLVFKLLDIV